ncbi:hypothetical protein KJ365_02945 [Glaciecola sp. XM2]|jgi:hypothetical protein|uniref:DUF6436 domain-containing protein n=1 Tax=Glaciecola sp. XM2 TaxID=1914931 RepID=UPI001BDEC96F|nr:DUF6436 domain-containing protein [Glaciecola sp. XM2]MBT1449824.1 hypothetical protein [Glaciecola sp. XM2]
MRFKKPLVLSLVALWFLSTTALVLAMNKNLSKAFDHDMRLSMQLMSLDFETQFVDVLHAHSSPNTNTLFHITSDDGCFCQNLAKKHMAKLNEIVAGRDFAIKELNISALDAVKAAIPSTPAVAVVNDQNKLIYLGPYSRGSGCFGSNGEVNAILENATSAPTDAAQQTYLQPAIIVTEARGCYCNDEG